MPVFGDSCEIERLDLLRHPPDIEVVLWDVLRQVPTGRVTTYGRLAEALGDRVAARWVGHVLLHHDHQPDCCCYRVVRASGEAGGYVTGRPADKIQALSADGIEVVDGHVSLERYLAPVACARPPLAALRQLQEALAERFSPQPPADRPATVGAVDVSYASSGIAVAAYGLFQIDDSAASAGAADDQAVWSTTLRRPVRFPYITSYLAFRELPLLLELIDQVRKAGRLADVVLVDGSGILHPRRTGIATMLGIVADLPTIGVTKKRLSGTVDLDGIHAGQLRPVWVDGRQLGWALRPGSGSKKPLFISPGHRASIAFCHDLFTSMTSAWSARRLPAPIHFVDRLSRRAAGSHGGQPVSAG